MPSMGPYSGPSHGGGMPYGTSFTPTYTPYGMSPHSGTGQPVGGHYPPFITGPPMQGMRPGQALVYGTAYYPTPYTASYGHGVYPSTGQPRPPGPPSRPASRAPSRTSGLSKSDNDKRTGQAEYDVSKIIVDGSNPMKLGQPALVLPGKEDPQKHSRFSYSFVLLYRIISRGLINVSRFIATRTTTKAQTIRPCTMGRKSPAGGERDGSEGSFLAGCHKRHRERVFDFQKQLRICELPIRGGLCCRLGEISRLEIPGCACSVSTTQGPHGTGIWNRSSRFSIADAR